MKCRIQHLGGVLLLSGTLFALQAGGTQQRYVLPSNLPVLSGNEAFSGNVYAPPYFSAGRGLDVWGDTVGVGATWNEGQHNGTIGRMMVRDNQGYVHLCYMRGLSADLAGPRHIFYNVATPDDSLIFGQGVQVETSSRAGYCTMDVDTNCIAFIAFHQITWSFRAHTAVAVDLFPRVGAFLVFEAPYLEDPPGYDLELIWPRIQLGRWGRIHLIATRNTGDPEVPMRQYYISGTYDNYHVNWDSTWTPIGHTMTIAADIGASPVSGKIAVAWTRPLDPDFPDPSGNYGQWNNDVWLLIDEDGLAPDFSQAVNLTNFVPPDSTLLPDTLAANGDTTRAFTDLCVFIDHNDNVHVAFTVRAYFSFGPEGPYSYWNASQIWHWTEEYPDQFSLIADFWEPENTVYCGAWNVRAQRPSLAEDPQTGKLLCSYQLYDVDPARLTDHLSLSGWGYPSGEVCLVASLSGGLNWGPEVNVTETLSPENAMAGECLSEICPSIAKQVDEQFYLLYVLDRDAGVVLQEEGDVTLNDVIYHTWLADYIPPDIDAIAEPPRAAPLTFSLAQNFPNPFNPTTAISYQLAALSYVNLEVYDPTGRLVATLVNGWRSPGEHEVILDGASLASGIYFYRLQVGDFSVIHKMVLLK